MDWEEYLRQGPRYQFKTEADEIEYHELIDACQRLSSVYHGDLRYKNCAKIIIAEKTNPFAVAKGCNKYCFRFQCTQTGRKSKYIREDELMDFGIFPKEANCGTGYLQEQHIADRIEPKINTINMRINSLLSSASQNIKSWHERYAEYLQSEEWQSKRMEVMGRDGFECVISGKTENLQVHHMTYARVGNESINDLVTLNRDVHRLVHAGDDKYKQRLAKVIEANGYNSNEWT